MATYCCCYSNPQLIPHVQVLTFVHTHSWLLLLSLILPLYWRGTGTPVLIFPHPTGLPVSTDTHTPAMASIVACEYQYWFRSPFCDQVSRERRVQRSSAQRYTHTDVDVCDARTYRYHTIPWSQTLVDRLRQGHQSSRYGASEGVILLQGGRDTCARTRLHPGAGRILLRATRYLQKTSSHTRGPTQDASSIYISLPRLPQARSIGAPVPFPPLDS